MIIADSVRQFFSTAENNSWYKLANEFVNSESIFEAVLRH